MISGRAPALGAILYLKIGESKEQNIYTSSENSKKGQGQKGV